MQISELQLPENPILEIGPGSHPHPSANVRIDVVPNPLAHFQMDVHELEFSDCVFEEVLMFESLEHTFNPLLALQEIHRVLKSGGKLTLSIPNVYYYRLFLRWALKGKVSAFHEHIWNWSAFEITKLCEKAGFIVEKIEPFNEDWNNAPSVFLPFFPRIAAHSIKISATKAI